MNDAIPVKIIICIENHDFDQYLRASAPQYTEEILFVQIENVPRAVADLPAEDASVEKTEEAEAVAKAANDS